MKWTFLLLLAACSGHRAPQCGDKGVNCINVPKTTSLVTYHCNVHLSGLVGSVLGSDHSGDIPVCLPPSLNTWLGSPQDIASVKAMSPADYSLAVARYGQDMLVEQLVALKALDLTGRFCDTIQGAAVDPLSVCTVSVSSRDPYCEADANFPHKVCVPTDCYNSTNPDGTLNPHACKCDTVARNADDCELIGSMLEIAP